MTQTPSAAANITKRVEKIISLNAIVVFIATLIIGVAALMTFQKITNYYTLKQEIETIKRSQANTNELLSYVEANKDIVGQIEAVFPNESNIDVAYQDIYQVAAKIDPQAQLKLKANIPGLYNQKSVLPMELSVSANTSSTLELLRRIERLPYIIEIISITLIDPYTQNGTTQISFRLYVDDEFSKP